MIVKLFCQRGHERFPMTEIHELQLARCPECDVTRERARSAIPEAYRSALTNPLGTVLVGLLCSEIHIVATRHGLTVEYPH
jgi:hypothetical protein